MNKDQYDDWEFEDEEDEEEDDNISIDCTCGAWVYGKDYKPVRRGDCICGSNEPFFRV